jgi:REP element-mobilizing transposase RayT
VKIDAKKYYRRSFRLKGYDYSLPGAYFITVVTHDRICLFGEVVEGAMYVNQFGKIVQRAWLDLPLHYPQVIIQASVIMPNHMHGIVVIHECENNRSRGGSQTRPYTSEGFTSEAKMIQYGLPEIVRAFKSFSARQINHIRNTHGVAVWQRSYFDHIIRYDQDFKNIWEYIQTNPLRWEEDRFRLSAVGNSSDL